MISLYERDNKIADVVQLRLSQLTSGRRQAGQGRSIEQEQAVFFTTSEPITLGESMGIQYSIQSDDHGTFNITDVRPTDEETTQFAAKRIR
jgi:hypothetical protein